VLWIGPAPVAERITAEAAAHGLEPDYHDKRLAMLAPAYGAIAEDLGVPFLDLFAALAGDRRWAQCLGGGRRRLSERRRLRPDRRTHRPVARLAVVAGLKTPKGYSVAVARW
ncbi:MAG: hypothetical protein ACE10M_13250, partial [Alphaproteobacteria bacterium]